MRGFTTGLGIEGVGKVFASKLAPTGRASVSVGVSLLAKSPEQWS